MSFDLFMQYLTNGISLGSLYALIAIGYTMVYGILRLINFAHGEIFMMSLYFAFYGADFPSLVPHLCGGHFTHSPAGHDSGTGCL